MRWRSALTGRSIVETDIGRSSQDEGNSNAREAIARLKTLWNAHDRQQPEPMGHYHSEWVLRSRGSAPGGVWGSAPALLASALDGEAPGLTHPQHQSREAGSCSGGKRSYGRWRPRDLGAAKNAMRRY